MLYVDKAKIPYHRMKMSHLIADSTDELAQAARDLQIGPRHINKRGKAEEHLDICQYKKVMAIKSLGAIEVSDRELVKKIRAKREKYAKSNRSI